jgi:hypothetical protein
MFLLVKMFSHNVAVINVMQCVVPFHIIYTSHHHNTAHPSAVDPPFLTTALYPHKLLTARRSPTAQRVILMP